MNKYFEYCRLNECTNNKKKLTKIYLLFSRYYTIFQATWKCSQTNLVNITRNLWNTMVKHSFSCRKPLKNRHQKWNILPKFWNREFKVSDLAEIWPGIVLFRNRTLFFNLSFKSWEIVEKYFHRKFYKAHL